MKVETLDIAYLRTRLSYNPETGQLVWLTARAKSRVGKVAGSVNSNGYITTRVDGKTYFIHRLAWAIYYGNWPDAMVDHEDCNKLNNRISNLRAATRSENCANQQLRKINTSGFKGVTWHLQSGKWMAQIIVNQKYQYLGLFDDPKEAHEAYLIAAKNQFKQFARSK